MKDLIIILDSGKHYYLNRTNSCYAIISRLGTKNLSRMKILTNGGDRWTFSFCFVLLLWLLCFGSHLCSRSSLSFASDLIYKCSVSYCVFYWSFINCGFGSFSSQFFFVWVCLDREKMKENNRLLRFYVLKNSFLLT